MFSFGSQALREHEMGVGCDHRAWMPLSDSAEILGGLGRGIIACSSLARPSPGQLEDAVADETNDEDRRKELDLSLVLDPKGEWIEFGVRGRRRFNRSGHDQVELSNGCAAGKCFKRRSQPRRGRMSCSSLLLTTESAGATPRH